MLQERNVASYTCQDDYFFKTTSFGKDVDDLKPLDSVGRSVWNGLRETVMAVLYNVKNRTATWSRTGDGKTVRARGPGELQQTSVSGHARAEALTHSLRVWLTAQDWAQEHCMMEGKRNHSSLRGHWQLMVPRKGCHFLQWCSHWCHPWSNK
jgi:hypothetical protein